MTNIICNGTPRLEIQLRKNQVILKSKSFCMSKDEATELFDLFNCTPRIEWGSIDVIQEFFDENDIDESDLDADYEVAVNFDEAFVKAAVNKDIIEAFYKAVENYDLDDIFEA